VHVRGDSVVKGIPNRQKEIVVPMAERQNRLQSMQKEMREDSKRKKGPQNDIRWFGNLRRKKTG
jgi:hypothetical protein